jgi:hypothetical protein
MKECAVQLLVEPDPIPGSMQFYSIPTTICNRIRDAYDHDTA